MSNESNALASLIGKTQHLPRPYCLSDGNPKFRAQRALNDKTHYVTDSSLKYHHSKILSALPASSGLFFKIIESVSIDPYNTKRGFRAVLFDIFGAVVYRPSLEETLKSTVKADKEFYKWFETFNELKHYRETIQFKHESLKRETEDMKEIFTEIHRQQWERIEA
jgi:hypothetical protein